MKGPIVKGNPSFIASLRRSYLDLIVRAFSNEISGGSSNLTDGTFKLTHRLSSDDQLYLSTYLSRDNMYSGENYGDQDLARESWGNAIVSTCWTHRFNTNSCWNTILFYSNYYFGIRAGGYEGNNQIEEIDYRNVIENIGLRSQITTFANEHRINWRTKFLL